MAFDFKIKKSKIFPNDNIFIVKNNSFNDERGNIWTSFIANDIENLIPQNVKFIHDKFSKSKNNVLRGIHGDSKSWKFVTCVFGSVQQVIVDCRKDSPTYGKYESFIINEKNNIAILIPPLFGNAYCVLSKEAIYHYKLAYIGSYLDADQQFSHKWNDPSFNIKWEVKTPILSVRDKNNNH